MSTETSSPAARRLDERTARLCERVRQYQDAADPFLRGRHATRVYRDEPELPVVLKRAEILARTLEELEPVVLPEQRIIGASYRRLRVHGGVSDEDAWRIGVLHPERSGFDATWPVPREVRDELSWWCGRDVGPRSRNRLRAQHSWLSKYGIAGPHGLVQGHTLPDHGILLNAGIAALRERIASRLRSAETERQRRQLQAMDRCLEGLSSHCLLCAEAARRKATEVEDSSLSQRLAEVAANCEALASERPDSFAQALQLAYFSNFADRMDTPGDASSYGRLDRLLLPFYEADRDRGTLTEEEAFELVCHFAAKQWGRQISNNITVGGLRPDGADGTNPVSFLLLEAMEATGLELDLSVRLHEGSPERFVRTVARVLRRGFGRPSVYNDEVAVPALVAHGVTPEDARDYAPLGCVEVMIPGRSAFRTMGMGMNLPKVLELTLNRGRCLVTGDRVWDDVPARYDSFESLHGEYRRRVREVVTLAVDIIREDERLEHEFRPRPWLTVLSRGGIRDALDVTAGQPKYDPVGVTLDGVADIANSLCAVRRLLFEEGRLSLEDLRGVLAADWEGHEALRQHVLNRLPRFGRDEKEVDALAREEADHYARCFEDLRTHYGGRFWPMIFGVGTSLIHWKGPRTGATPSGRRHADSLAMSLQPSPAGAQGTTTALLCSVASLDFSRFPGGVSNVQELNPALFEGEPGLRRLVELIRGFFSMGGMEFAPNFIGEDTLRAAQAETEEFRHLTVRLFGLSAYFVSLSREVQEQVIERVAAAGRRQA